ncbi:GNAT family N-acetyltransferase [Paracoccus luteus]|uniref:GNAT family N-acetyltransferase n=1 Tax=Paracoccus luteus TaxID=2508543 RepID=UPI00106FA344|nr:GNAT family N-acetyltransferase [Paracoccus luteus]
MSAGSQTLSAVVPVVETDRLILRAPRLGDLDAIAAFAVSDRSRFVGGPGPAWQGWSSLTGMIGHWVLRGFGWWVVEDRATGAVAGRVGMGQHVDWPEPELGWHIYEGFEGRGLAFEAALAARRCAQGRQGLGRMISLVHPENTRSRRLAERMGAVPEREFTLRGNPCIVYRHPQEAA